MSEHVIEELEQALRDEHEKLEAALTVLRTIADPEKRKSARQLQAMAAEHLESH